MLISKHIKQKKQGKINNTNLLEGIHEGLLQFLQVRAGLVDRQGLGAQDEVVRQGLVAVQVHAHVAADAGHLSQDCEAFGGGNRREKKR